MRTTTLRSILVLSLSLSLVAVLGCASKMAPPRAGNGKPPTKGAKGDVQVSWDVTAYSEIEIDDIAKVGEVADDAEKKAKQQAVELARDRAQRQAIAYFLHQTPPLLYAGAEDDVKVLLKDHLKEKDATIKKEKRVFMATLPVELSFTAADYRELVHKDRQYRATHRQANFFPILVGFAALFGAVGLYFRINEATRGRYTTWFRAAAVLLVGLTGLGTWLVS